MESLRPDASGHAERVSDLPTLAIRRPWLVVVINLLIVIAGVAAWLGVEVRELPNIDRPVVAVRADFPGAAPETLDAEVTRIVEAAAARVPGVVLVRSASEEGNFRVILEFTPGTDLVTAANDVRDAVARAERSLPEGVENLTVIRADADAEPVMQLAVASNQLSVQELSRLVEDQIEPALVAVPGVADVNLFGQRARTLRVRLDTARMDARGVDLATVAGALAGARADVPAGSLRRDQQDLLVRADLSLNSAAQIKALRLGPGLMLGDVAEVYDLPADAESLVRLDGRSVVSLGVVRQAQSNSVEISDGVRAAVTRLQAALPGVDITVVSDDAVFIRGAIGEVLGSLALAVAIVVAVVALFLGGWRQAVVPTVAIPVALVGTLAAIWLLGFSINLITLLAMLLATGLVVDDAIVVLENIQRRRAMGLGPRAAAVLGTREVFFAVVATTATLVAVFVPISFLPSQAGRLFAEFGFVMAIAVALSSFVALSLGPMLAARLAEPAAPGAVGRRLNAVGRGGVRAYERAIGAVLRHAWVSFTIGLLLFGGALALATQIDRELVPTEDRGVLVVRIDGPEGANLAYADRQLELALAAVRPLQDEGLVSAIFTVTGRWDPNRAEIVAPLADWSERGDPAQSQQALAARVQRALADLPGARVRVRSGNSLGVGGGDGSVQMAIGGDDHARIAEVAERFAEAIDQRLPGLADVRVGYEVSKPQLTLAIDRTRAAELGVPLEGLSLLLRALVDGTEITQLNVGDRTVPVRLESQARGSTDPRELLQHRLHTADGRQVPLGQFVRITETAIAGELERLGQRRAVEMSATSTLPLADAVSQLRALAAEILPPEMALMFRGDAATLEQSSNELALTFAIALLVVFLVLVAQFESVTSAAVVLASVPFGVASASFVLWATGTSLNVYSQIGLLLLIGVTAKNSILMVEFADQLRDAGRSVAEAAREAAGVRLRPIVMTMASTVLGALPLVISDGPGAESRQAIGWVIFGGLGLGALMTLFLTPVLYLGLARFTRPRAAQGELLQRELDDAMREGA